MWLFPDSRYLTDRADVKTFVEVRNRLMGNHKPGGLNYVEGDGVAGVVPSEGLNAVPVNRINRPDT